MSDGSSTFSSSISHKTSATMAQPDDNAADQQDASQKFASEIKKHRLHIDKQIRKNISILYKLRPLVPLHVLRSFYFAQIESKMRYCITVYGNSLKTNSDKLERTNKMLLKIMMQQEYKSVPYNMYQKLNILNFTNLYKNRPNR